METRQTDPGTFRKDNVARSLDKNFDELYEYDRLHRLRKFHRGLLVENNSVIESPALQQGWVLDSTGNWRNFTQNDQQDSARALDQRRVHNQVNEITKIARTVGQQWATPEYDRNGNMVVIPQPKEMDETYQATWDAWNRLVRLEQHEDDVSSSSSSSSASGNTVLVVRYGYNGLNWQITKTADEETRHFYYSSAWQCLEERIDASSDPDKQYVWGLRYIDDIILRDRDMGQDGILNERLHALQDANWNVVAVIDTTADVVERYAYSAYGVPLFLSTDYESYESSIRSWETLFTGQRLDSNTELMHFRNRYFLAALGLFVARDPLGYADGANLYAGYFAPDGLDPFGLVTWYTDFWYERHHWFPQAKRKTIETLCSKVNFKIDAFVTPLLAARDVSELDWWESLTGVKKPRNTDNRDYHDHRWLEVWRSRKWKDIVDANLKGKNCCQFLKAMKVEIQLAYKELQARSSARGSKEYGKPIEQNMGVFVGGYGSTFPQEYWFFDEMGERYDYSGIQTWPLLEAAIVAACRKGRKDDDPQCDEWVNERRRTTPLSGGGLISDPVPEMIFGGIGAGILRGVGAAALPAASSSGAAGGSTILRVPRPAPLRRAG